MRERVYDPLDKLVPYDVLFRHVHKLDATDLRQNALCLDQPRVRRRVQIDLLGLARDTDPSWVDWSDPDPATRPYRKFQLIGDFQLRNAGMVGLEDSGGTGFGSL